MSEARWPGLRPGGSGPVSRQVAALQWILPLVILITVVLYELWLSTLPPGLVVYGRLIFYATAGPAVTFFVLNTIRRGALAWEQARQDVHTLYGELQASHTRLQAVQALTRGLNQAPDLETALDAAARGSVESTGATHARLRLTGGLTREARGRTLLHTPSEDLHRHREALQSGGEAVGELELYFETPPGEEALALCGVVAAECATALQAARQRSRDLLTLYEVEGSIRAERNLRRLLSRLSQNMAERAGATHWAAFLMGGGGMRLAVGSAGELRGPPPFVLRVAAGDGPELSAPGEEAALWPGAALCLGLPLREGSEPLGVIVLGFDTPPPELQGRIPLLALLASQGTLALRNARAYLFSEELAIGEERSRIARDIHDGVAQSLAFCAMRLDLAERRSDPDALRADLQLARETLREQIRELRRAIFALRPVNLEEQGLHQTLRRYAHDFGEQHGLRVSAEITGGLSLSPATQASVFRLLQESLNNVAKHARARAVWVSLRDLPGRVELRVRDDGQGFSGGGNPTPEGGLGLRQMRERVSALGGELTVESAAEGGTELRALLPAEV